ncbi:hypothetical protein GOP47_0009624 [Adiantum capillus-veneris]|uniref:YqgF/RNase H-like domain-containing protein n=1 Tax=Adiantum capillus-veneris TaxID=13818 RepID=A0A9D4ZHB9_ADICA|nr:hypothetical protein GOP47_0009624 [Adiantum capillus-veneris]
MTFAPSPILCTRLLPSLKPSLRSSNFTLKQHARFNTLATIQPLTKTTRKKVKEDSSLGDEHVFQLSHENFEREQAYVDKPDVEDERSRMRNEQILRAELKKKLSQLLSNAERLKNGSSEFPCYSLGIDFGDARTGVAISKGFAPRPIEVVELQGQRLEARLIEIAHKEGAIEFVVGLPKSERGMETWQSNKTRCFAGRLAALAAQRGWRVYLHDEFGSSNDALEYMIMTGSTKKTRKTHLDAYAAVVLLQAYFNNSGEHAELVVPKKLSLQERLCEAPIGPESDDASDLEDEQL